MIEETAMESRNVALVCSYLAIDEDGFGVGFDDCVVMKQEEIKRR